MYIKLTVTQYKQDDQVVKNKELEVDATAYMVQQTSPQNHQNCNL